SFRHIVPVLLVTFTLGIAMAGQQQREYSPLYVSHNKYLPRGWTFAPGLTYMFPAQGSRDELRTVFSESEIDTLYNGTFKAAGRPGFCLEAGRHHFLDRFYFLHHIDYGARFTMLRGSESFSGMMKADSVMIPVDNKGTFSESFASVFFNASNTWQLSDNTWIHNSLGFHADYRVISNRSYEGPVTGMLQQFPENFLLQLHYKIGFGWRPEPGIYLMPMLETPILSLVPLDDGKSTLPYFSSRYRPVIFTLRIMFLDKMKNMGPECGNQPRDGGMPTGVDKESAGKHKGSSLFGPDVKSKRAKMKGGG
ncbi:MAG: hypothetical protein JNM00_12305, partial [Flavobacteriales bacterium]|nr:hypothetical protein [Flavobacteriales bacterium]